MHLDRARQLPQAARAAQLGAQTPQRMAVAQFVITVGADRQQRFLRRRPGQRR